MANIKIPTAFNIDLEFEAANIFIRFLGWFIDLVIRVLFVLVMVVILRRFDLSEDAYYLWFFFLCMLPLSFYFLVFEIAMNGQSPGKRLLGIKVTGMTGNRPGISQHLIRWVFRLLEAPLFFWNGIIPIVAMARSPYNQRLGDIVAGTIVVNTRSKSSLQETIFREIDLTGYKPQFPQILKLSDRDLNKVKQLLDQAVKSGNLELAARVSYRVREVLHIETDMGHTQFLETLLNDYNYYTTR